MSEKKDTKKKEVVKAPAKKEEAKTSAPKDSKVVKAKAKKAVVQAKKASKMVKKGEKKHLVQVRRNVHFHLPHTLRKRRVPKYERKSRPSRPMLNKYSIIKSPLCTESAMKQIEDNNTLTFIVDIKANKKHIAEAISSLYEVDVVRVNTLIRPDGIKKAYARLSADVEALEVANRIGII
eukprot:TRINITY_DN10457_c0_g1_i1.p2 TRINITY_DN10457_c0_g1~~TRINITY_DN10457_c0_g1_i1.p2  ORF type:complete len:186 (+),score=58.70 TRINITY_DN10457_c0_g1_i1:24-560(+)